MDTLLAWQAFLRTVRVIARKGAENVRRSIRCHCRSRIKDRRDQEFHQKGQGITRRKYTPEEKIRIVLEGFRHDVPIRDLCRREGIRPNVYYAWLRDFMEAGKTRLARDTVRDATRDEVDSIRRENERLKQLVADLSLQVHMLKKTEVPGLE
jgi:transposase